MRAWRELASAILASERQGLAVPCPPKGGRGLVPGSSGRAVAKIVYRTLQCDTQRARLLGDGHNSIPITLLRMVLHIYFFVLPRLVVHGQESPES